MIVRLAFVSNFLRKALIHPLHCTNDPNILLQIINGKRKCQPSISNHDLIYLFFLYGTLGDFFICINEMVTFLKLYGWMFIGKRVLNKLYIVTEQMAPFVQCMWFWKGPLSKNASCNCGGGERSARATGWRWVDTPLTIGPAPQSSSLGSGM